MTIFESPTAQSKAFFTTRVREDGQASTLARLRADPASIAEPVDGRDRPRATWRPAAPAAQDVPVPLAEYRPNGLRATFEAPGPGLFVVKDSYFPGWRATVNGQPAEVIRVNGLVRGVVVPAAGQYEVTMAYRPTSFVSGLAISAATVVLLALLVAWEFAARRRKAPACGGRP